MFCVEIGFLLGIVYFNMWGYGDIYFIVVELCVGYLFVLLFYFIFGELMEVGDVLMIECEIVVMYEVLIKDSKFIFGLGYGVCFGYNEVKVIFMVIFDCVL